LEISKISGATSIGLLPSFSYMSSYMKAT
jgi:hypothetical protein